MMTKDISEHEDIREVLIRSLYVYTNRD